MMIRKVLYVVLVLLVTLCISLSAYAVPAFDYPSPSNTTSPSLNLTVTYLNQVYYYSLPSFGSIDELYVDDDIVTISTFEDVDGTIHNNILLHVDPDNVRVYARSVFMPTPPVYTVNSTTPYSVTVYHDFYSTTEKQSYTNRSFSGLIGNNVSTYVPVLAPQAIWTRYLVTFYNLRRYSTIDISQEPILQSDVESYLDYIYNLGYESDNTPDSVFDGLFSGFTSILTTPLFGSYSIGSLLLSVIAIVIVIVAIRFFAGG